MGEGREYLGCTIIFSLLDLLINKSNKLKIIVQPIKKFNRIYLK